MLKIYTSSISCNILNSELQLNVFSCQDQPYNLYFFPRASSDSIQIAYSQFQYKDINGMSHQLNSRNFTSCFIMNTAARRAMKLSLLVTCHNSSIRGLFKQLRHLIQVLNVHLLPTSAVDFCLHGC